MRGTWCGVCAQRAGQRRLQPRHAALADVRHRCRRRRPLARRRALQCRTRVRVRHPQQGRQRHDCALDIVANRATGAMEERVGLENGDVRGGWQLQQLRMHRGGGAQRGTGDELEALVEATGAPEAGWLEGELPLKAVERQAPKHKHQQRRGWRQPRHQGGQVAQRRVVQLLPPRLRRVCEGEGEGLPGGPELPSRLQWWPVFAWQALQLRARNP